MASGNPERPAASRSERFDRPLHRLLVGGCLLAVLLAAFWPFSDALGFYFLKTDTGGLLYSARILSPGDLGRILTHPVKSLSRRPLPYYRPLSSLSFGLDYALWGLNPMGYHLTDLILHTVVAGLLFGCVYRFNGRDVLSAGLAGLFYTLHPVLVDVVPVSAHRQETLAALFLLVGWRAWYRAEFEAGGAGWRTLALLAFLLSVGAKEVGILFLPLVLFHLHLKNPGEASGFLDRIRETLLRGAPYVLTALAYTAWWARVTGARAFLGGGQGMRPSILRTSWWNTVYEQLLQLPARTLPVYLRALLHPFQPLYESVGSWALSPLVRPPDGLTTAAGALVLLGVVVLLFRRLFRDPGVGGSIQRPDPPSLLLYGVWLGLPAVFYSVTRVAGFKNSYHGVLPLCALLATAVALALRFVARHAGRANPSGCPRGTSRSRVSLAAGAGLLLLLALHGGLLLAASPLVRAYPTWRHSQDLEGQFNRQLIRQMETLPGGSKVWIRGIPLWAGSADAFPHVAPRFRGMPHRRWLRMHLRNRDYRVDKSGVRLVEDPCPCPLWLEKRQLGARDFLFVTHVRYDGDH